MKIFVVGAGGGVGKEVVTQALEAGHHVVGVYRRLLEDTSRPGLEPVQGSVLDAVFLSKVLPGCDVVVSATGTMDFKKSLTLYSEGTRALDKAMKSAGVRRLIVLSAGGATVEANDPWLFRWILKPILNRVFRHLYDDMRRMEALLETMDLDWTVVRLPYLTNQAKTGIYQVAHEGGVRYRRSIGRADAAHYIVTHLESQGDFRKFLCIAN